MFTITLQIDGVLAVHEFHVWSLAGDKIVASLHLHLRSLDDYVRVSNEVKEYFHDEGIHSVTIQPEFLEVGWINARLVLLSGRVAAVRSRCCFMGALLLYGCVTALWVRRCFMGASLLSGHAQCKYYKFVFYWEHTLIELNIHTLPRVL